MARKKIKENPDLVKDTASGAVINTNSNAFTRRREQMRLAQEKDNKILQLEKDVAELKKLIKDLSK
jgi:t-SNARE complex subunit (syntaxin)